MSRGEAQPIGAFKTGGATVFSGAQPPPGGRGHGGLSGAVRRPGWHREGTKSRGLGKGGPETWMPRRRLWGLTPTGHSVVFPTRHPPSFDPVPSHTDQGAWQKRIAPYPRFDQYDYFQPPSRWPTQNTGGRPKKLSGLTLCQGLFSKTGKNLLRGQDFISKTHFSCFTFTNPCVFGTKARWGRAGNFLFSIGPDI